MQRHIYNTGMALGLGLSTLVTQIEKTNAYYTPPPLNTTPKVEQKAKPKVTLPEPETQYENIIKSSKFFGWVATDNDSKPLKGKLETRVRGNFDEIYTTGNKPKEIFEFYEGRNKDEFVAIGYKVSNGKFGFEKGISPMHIHVVKKKKVARFRYSEENELKFMYIEGAKEADDLREKYVEMKKRASQSPEIIPPAAEPVFSNYHVRKLIQEAHHLVDVQTIINSLPSSDFIKEKSIHFFPSKEDCTWPIILQSITYRIDPEKEPQAIFLHKNVFIKRYGRRALNTRFFSDVTEADKNKYNYVGISF